MPADEQIRVTFLRIDLHESSRRRTSGRFRFTARVGSQSFGETEGQRALVDTRGGTMQINLEPLNWTCDVRVAGLQRLEIRVDGQKLRRILNQHLGTTRHRFTQVLTLPGTNLLHVPQRAHQDFCRHFTVHYRVETCIQDRFQMHMPYRVFATRAHNGGVAYTTVSGLVRLSRIEICPVIPIPPLTTLPPRPVFPTTAQPSRTLVSAATVNPTDPINAINNPAFIPILSNTEANGNNTAHLTVTYYRPWTLFFQPNDTRLEWSAEPANRIRFLNNDNHGLSVKVYGTGTSSSADIDVTFTLKFEGEQCAKFRAVLGPIKNIPCRFNIFNGPPGPTGDPMRHRPRSTPADVQQQMHMANIFLRQTGIQMQFDSNTTQNTTRPGGGPAPLSITSASTAGIYSITVPSAQTRNAPWNSIWLKANYRANVMNFCYLKSSSLGNVLGFAFKWPEHPDSTSTDSRWDFTENGSPSTSWIQPSGNPPDTAAQAITMKVIAGYKCNDALPAALNGMAIMDGNDPSTDAGRREYAGTIAHELGHMLSMGHRIEDPSIAGGSYDDELTFPPRQNLMHYNASTATAQDFDIAQTKVMRSSALIP